MCCYWCECWPFAHIRDVKQSHVLDFARHRTVWIDQERDVGVSIVAHDIGLELLPGHPSDRAMLSSGSDGALAISPLKGQLSQSSIHHGTRERCEHMHDMRWDGTVVFEYALHVRFPPKFTLSDSSMYRLFCRDERYIMLFPARAYYLASPKLWKTAKMRI